MEENTFLFWRYFGAFLLVLVFSYFIGTIIAWLLKKSLPKSVKKYFIKVRWSLILLLTTIFIGVGLLRYIQGYIDWNPVYEKSELYGKWLKNDHELILRQDDTALCNVDLKRKAILLEEPSKYQWRFLNNTIYLRDPNTEHTIELRIVEYAGKPRILDEYNKSDMIAYDLGFSKHD